MEAQVVNQSKSRTHQKKIQAMLDAVVRGLSLTKVRNQKLLKSKLITLVFLDAKEMKQINKQFRKKNKPTDVLSFASMEEGSLGELIFCLDVLKKQAKEQGHSLENEFLYMLIHGILHLLGYDHELSLKEEKLMFKIQDQLFQSLTPA
ncbi:rRNA maturation RNase YbeY [Bdellovibrio sp. qaytius]|nr:rRNA maturation RNase YbeY [Bdellovibrio sp. qaytius]